MFSNLTQLVGVPLNSVMINLGSSAVVEWASFSSSSCLCVTSNSASIFPCYIRHLCTLLVANTTQLNGAPLLTVVLVVFFPFSCIFPLVCCLRTLQAFLFPQENMVYLAFTSFFHCLTDWADTSWSIFISYACEIRSDNLPTIFSTRLLAISILSDFKNVSSYFS